MSTSDNRFLKEEALVAVTTVSCQRIPYINYTMPLPTKRIAQRFAQLHNDHVCVCLLSQPTGKKHVKVQDNQII